MGIHENDIENIPLTLFLHLVLVLIQTTVPTAKFIMITYTVSRYIHTFWYAWYGSHEIRATLWSSIASATTQQFARSWRQPGTSESHRDAINSFRFELSCTNTKAGSAYRRGPKRPPETAIDEIFPRQSRKTWQK